MIKASPGEEAGAAMEMTSEGREGEIGRGEKVKKKKKKKKREREREWGGASLPWQRVFVSK
jgi:hypothetical protein